MKSSLLKPKILNTPITAGPNTIIGLPKGGLKIVHLLG